MALQIIDYTQGAATSQDEPLWIYRVYQKNVTTRWEKILSSRLMRKPAPEIGLTINPKEINTINTFTSKGFNF